jgi:catechol 2,3-dioxygenase-like lactoylglutathione lyase family enzyme
MKLLKTMLICLVTTSALHAHGRETTPQPASQPIIAATGAFFALSVADIDASRQWYIEKLGLKVIFAPPRSGPGDVVVLEGGGILVELIRHGDALPLGKLTPQVSESHLVHGFFKGGVLVADFEQTLALLKSRDVKIAYGPYPARNGIRANFIVSDNAGNLIQFFGPA